MDEEGPPEMRNIQYDLSPEKMEKIWVNNLYLIKSSNQLNVEWNKTKNP